MPSENIKCRHCGWVFACESPHLAWLAGSYVRDGCPSCGHYLDAGHDLIALSAPSDRERRANVCTPDPAVALTESVGTA